ncbi:MAG: hypothetical protein GY842_24335 [bacterium]|nr:hypothetical protein [bacterium]
MLQWCMFGGYDGQFGSEAKTCFTMFGACELCRPTMARELLTLRGDDGASRPPGKKFIITIFGGTDINCPTLTEEFIDLREAVRSGALDLNQWDRHMTELSRLHQDDITSFTLFAGFGEASLPDEDKEIEALALQRHLGSVGDESSRILEAGIGQGGAQRRAVIHQALLAD